MLGEQHEESDTRPTGRADRRPGRDRGAGHRRGSRERIR